MSTSWVKKVLLLLCVASAFGVFCPRGRQLVRTDRLRPDFFSADPGLRASARARKELAFVEKAQELNAADDVICLCGCVGCGCSVDESSDAVLADEMHEILSDALSFFSSIILNLLEVKDLEAKKVLLRLSAWMKKIESERAVVGSTLLDLLITDQPILGPKGYGIDCVEAVNVIDVNKFVNTTIGVGFDELCELHKDDSPQVVSLIKDFCELFEKLFPASPQMQALILFVQMFWADVAVGKPARAASSSRVGLPLRTPPRGLQKSSRQIFKPSPSRSASSAGSLGSLVEEFGGGWGFYPLCEVEDSRPGLGEALRDSDDSEASEASVDSDDTSVSGDLGDRSLRPGNGFAFCMPRAGAPATVSFLEPVGGRVDRASRDKENPTTRKRPRQRED
ncbi:hypothetical protein FJ366_03605 [Candidatus Dependentiae bacterium]|nr:hypothetical protein [Candidatus Dependentiae bacterium]